MPSVDTASAILASLDALGLTHVLYCPGSRSAPFAYALEAGAFSGDARAVLDERGAGFMAVGLARTGALPAIVVTSGTAVAELAPAVLEASHARLPLLVVSADRPGELRGVGASQATDQSRLFGTHVRAQVDLEPQEASTTLVGHLTRCVAAACGAPTGTPGPVQINVAFRDPLTPASPASASASGDEAGASFVPRPTRVLPASPVSARWEDVVGPAAAGLIIAGEGASPRAREWSEASGFPLLAEPASGAWADGGVTPFEQSLVASSLGREVDTVVVMGRPTLSRPIHALLARPDVRVILVDPHAPWVDVSGNASVVVADLEPAREPIRAAQAEWASRVRDAARDAGERIDSLLAAGSGRTTLDLARAVAASTSGPLVLGASNPVRAFDLAVPTLEGRVIHSNRGQAGIDGTIATAVGIAVGAGYGGEATVPASERVTAVMGDLTACHDASSLALAAATRAHLDIIVADDRGGGIFATLEHGRATTPEAYDRWFGVAQEVDYEALTAAYHLAFARVDNPAQLARVLETPQAGPRLVHVPVERGAHLYGAIRDILN
ncbi:2-succinyl-5-enolpyruvyl-6-hydroxy-3-cyclohexene-1-carboxylic-acid synthase [Isoptericola variabilis]|uniref:2-succinyl-5-enolpyruvyl-6-hydroxy-3- cyclohexene-1-carboxylic-acid synthase n=1 Tax=Isoptericola variabilis TaxID=139208 RepID=UPI0006616EF7|nr:2-succinyl-5-enolpyruvyl-6-hydroxy-3-cyclohexene-1-carboxylic-acid synthase [Isoptericola variabilis]